MWEYRFNMATKMQSSQWAGKFFTDQKRDEYVSYHEFLVKNKL